MAVLLYIRCCHLGKQSKKTQLHLCISARFMDNIKYIWITIHSKQILNVAAIHNNSYVNNLLFYLPITFMQ